jgi:glycerate 2-kinase
MRILVAPDKFKGSIDAVRLCQAIGDSLKSFFPDAEIILRPLADGGDGFASLMGFYFPVETRTVETIDPLGRSIRASYTLTRDRDTAFVEMSVASGLALLKPEERNPELTDTRGTGILIGDALQQGAKHVVLGIGGSATNDGGMGMAHALGYRLLDDAGQELMPCGAFLGALRRILDPNDTAFADARFTVACDVKNPLHGPAGAACVFGPQKGADPLMVARLDAGLRNLDAVFQATFSQSFADLSGAGAAGGLGAGAMAFLGAEMRPGFELMAEMIGLEAEIAAADLVITGEGRLDGQSFQGKVVGEVLAMSGQYGKPVFALCGITGTDLSMDQRGRFAGISALTDHAPDVASAMEDPALFIPHAIRSLAGSF